MCDSKAEKGEMIDSVKLQADGVAMMMTPLLSKRGDAIYIINDHNYTRFSGCSCIIHLLKEKISA